MDPEAANYNPNAGRDGECSYDKSGCTDSTASNYLPLANVDDGSCTIQIFGCTDPNAVPTLVQVIFDSTATVLADG
eukprot:scaffold106041_cov67-Phaeocystis_antarctica.AAC.1